MLFRSLIGNKNQLKKALDNPDQIVVETTVFSKEKLEKLKNNKENIKNDCKNVICEQNNAEDKK